MAEGPKVVGDLLCVMRPTLLIATPEWMGENKHLQQNGEWMEVSDEELAKASFLKHPQQVLAVFPTSASSNTQQRLRVGASAGIPTPNTQHLTLMLDSVQAPN